MLLSDNTLKPECESVNFKCLAVDLLQLLHFTSPFRTNLLFLLATFSILFHDLNVDFASGYMWTHQKSTGAA